MAKSTDSYQAVRNPNDAVDEIHRLMGYLAMADWEHRTLAEFLELLEDGEEWVTKMRKFCRS